MSERTALQPELLWLDGRFQRSRRIEIDGDGRIAAVGPAKADEPTWSRRAVLPGLVNAHSHAFQRGLRGHGETFEAGRGSFWTWREAMYDLVGSMTEQKIFDLSRQAFAEMLASGITAVGEFHYLHHDDTERGYAFDDVVLSAAADAGIRIVLLNAYYNTGGIGEPLAGGQKRFGSPSLDDYLDQLAALQSKLSRPTESLGLVAHSIRAVPLDDLVGLSAEATRRDMVLHMHVEEQPAEIEACVKAYGAAPMAVINERLEVTDRFCAVHCTHTDPADMATFLASDGRVCICPLTEANLGDGIAHVPDIRAAGGSICLGTDSNLRIDFVEEMRWLEYAQRLDSHTRGVVVDDSGSCGAALLDTATQHGAAALGLDAGTIQPGALADFCALDLDAPTLAGADDTTLLDAFIFGGGPEAIATTCVGGRWTPAGPD